MRDIITNLSLLRLDDSTLQTLHMLYPNANALKSYLHGSTPQTLHVLYPTTNALKSLLNGPTPQTLHVLYPTTNALKSYLRGPTPQTLHALYPTTNTLKSLLNGPTPQILHMLYPNANAVRIIFAWFNAVGVVLLVAQGWRGTSLPWVNYPAKPQRCRRCTFYNKSQPHKYIMQKTTRKTYNTYGVASHITRFNPG